MSEWLELFLIVDESIPFLIMQYGIYIYAILFFIIFLETGLVVFNFLPGDGLLFSAGIVAASGELEYSWLLVSLTFATFLGNTSNHFIGRWMGMKFFNKEKKDRNEYLSIAFFYFEKYQGMAILLSRFVPFMRSFIPFVSGVSKMQIALFTFFNLIGGILWISLYVSLGFFFGEIPWVKANFGKVFLLMIGIMVLIVLFAGVRKIIKNFRAAK